MDFAEILARAQDDDEGAREELVERFYPAVQQLVHRELAYNLRRSQPWVASLFSTSDVVHDVFVAVLRNLEAFQGTDERAFERFLARAVMNRLLDSLRFYRAGRRDVRRAGGPLPGNLTQEAENAPSPLDDAIRGEVLAAVEDAMGSLTERDRKLLEMRFRESATYGEIASALGIPSADGARKALCAAQARLLVRLRSRGVR